MAKTMLKKEKWTITFDPILKGHLQKEARKLRIYPVQLLESLVREKMSPYGFQSVRNSITYVNSIREKSVHRSDKDFISELKQWQKH